MTQSRNLKFDFQGFEEFNDLVEKIQSEFGEKDSAKILVSAVRHSLRPTLSTAKSLLEPGHGLDTGALRASLQIEARKPNSKDRNSKYYSPGEIVIGRVSTAPGNRLKKKSFFNLHNTKSNIKQIGIGSDGRAMFTEFGTAKESAKPYLRPALEHTATAILDSLSIELGSALEKYKSKHP